MVMIANPAAAGEGISLHNICHDAIYLDRSYNTTHYLQSIDRIHRLGLAPGVETYIHIFQTVAPQGIGSIDGSVNRRLAINLRNLQQLLNDPDLHELALYEENAVDPTNYGIELADLIDLIEELEGKGRRYWGLRRGRKVTPRRPESLFTMCALNGLVAIRRDTALMLVEVAPSDPDVHAEIPLFLRQTLTLLIEKVQPWWLRLAPTGRERVKLALSSNEAQRLEAADLFAAFPSAEVRQW